MYRVIQIKDSKLYLHYIFDNNDVNLTVNNPMLYTEDKYINRDIKRLKALGIETEVRTLEIKDKDLIKK